MKAWDTLLLKLTIGEVQTKYRPEATIWVF